MLTYILMRISMTNDCTFGVMKDENNIPFMVTLELPWRNNQHDISCIPVGTYKCIRINSPKHGNCFELQGVQDRQSVEIHIGNYPKDTEGCILTGTSFDGTAAVGRSTEAFQKFMQKLNGQNEFNLRIQEVL
jgi:hypothetical protein